MRACYESVPFVFGYEGQSLQDLPFQTPNPFPLEFSADSIYYMYSSVILYPQLLVLGKMAKARLVSIW